MKIKGNIGEEYLLTVEITANSDTTVTLFTNHRRILIRNKALKKGEHLKETFGVALREAKFQKQPDRFDDEIELTLEGDAELSAAAKKAELPTIYCLGDSTVCDQNYFGSDEIHRCCGWGQTLGMYLKDKYALSNHAEQGTHTSDCLGLHINPVLSQIKKGDIVLVQFGHNDQKQSYLGAFEGYIENLRRIVELVEEKDGKCILCTPINRLIYVDGKLNDYLDSYAAAVKNAAKEKNLMCVDLHGFTSELYVAMGKDAENLFYHGDELDRTHMNDIGAVAVGEFVYNSISCVL